MSTATAAMPIIPEGSAHQGESPKAEMNARPM
ncbi:hypothetical protein KBTX_03328 [wastewater metagenome]|uniref:Uncharacterized protein n=2 Tax=unclassified sequences TaxID=12908 RepID=A0A5B8RIU0_9ZZZZ|nr:hypothetical protein KBTEX_03328 [uncultured organism]